MQRLAWTSLVLATAACTTLAPPHQRPELPVPQQFPLAVTDGASAPALGWRDHFADPQLLALIDQALGSNRDIRLAAIQVQEARVAHGIQRADTFPTVSAGADASRTRTPADLSYMGRATTTAQYQVALGVTAWELDLWGRVRSLEDAALESYLAADHARRAVHLALIAEVANSYYSFREADERLALAVRTVASHEATERIFRRRAEVGAISRLELLQVQTLLHQARSLQAQLQQSRARAINTLTLLVGSPLSPLAPALPLEERALLQEVRADLPSALLAGRPDVMAAEHRLYAATANIGAARAAFFPRIALTASAGTASAQLDGLFDTGSGAWRFAPTLSLPIFDHGRRQANLNLTELRRDAAVANYEKTVQAAFRDVANALAARHWLTEQIGIQQQALAVHAERARLTQLRFDSGSAAFIEVLDAQRELLTAEQQLVQTRAALIIARVSLYAALGGGAQFVTDADVSLR